MPVKLLDTSKANLAEEINDLATCPKDPYIVASASQDTTVRIWSLDPSNADQPCLVVLGGDGHTSGLLATVSCTARNDSIYFADTSQAFHSCGRYVLSAGHDNCVCMVRIRVTISLSRNVLITLNAVGIAGSSLETAG